MSKINSYYFNGESDGPSKAIEGYLNEFTPNGLFEASNGNKYVITSCQVIGEDSALNLLKTAVALVHRHLLPFTMQILDEQPLEHGYWCGSYRIRLANASSEECGMGFPGIISLGDQHASIQCRDLDDEYHMVSLRHVGPKGFEFRDFDGWTVEPTSRAAFPFFQKTPIGNLNLLLRPNSARDEFGAGICNSLKQMLKEGTMEKVLARPDSTKYAYYLSASGMLLG